MRIKLTSESKIAEEYEFVVQDVVLDKLIEQIVSRAGHCCIVSDAQQLLIM
jgi:hypothetical protein